MNLFSKILSDQLINAFGWSLFHILWQGFLLAIIIGIVLSFLKNKSAQLRYIISFIGLVVIVGLSVFNFSSNFDKESQPVSNKYILQESDNSDLLLIDVNQVQTSLNSKEILSDLKNNISKIDHYFPLVVNFWIIGILIFTLKFILGFFYSNQLKTAKTIEISKKWIQQFGLIERKLKVKRSIRYIESKLIKIPLVIGYLKPVVVIPAEMLTGIPFEQIEAIIAHEIAHIRRNDYIFNVLQTIIETVFFFHPAVWYISSQIRKERENCCDDMALTVCKESLVYAKALVSVQELSLKRHYSAVAFSGKKKHLLNRIKRMIMKPKVKTNFTDRIIAAIIIISGVFALSFTYTAKTYDFDTESNFKNEVYKPANESLKEIVETSSNPLVIRKDTIVVRKDRDHNEIEIDDNKVIKTYRKDGEKSKMEFKIKNGKAYDLYVNGEKIPESEYAKYQKEIDKTMSDLEDAKEDIREAMKDIEELDLENIQMEVQEEINNIHIDVAEMQKEIARAMEEMHEIDVEDILKEVEASVSHLEDLDFDFDLEIGDLDINIEEIKAEIEKANIYMRENVDMKEIEKEIQRAHEELKSLHEEDIRMQLEEELKEFDMKKKEEIIKELEEKLQELEKLELEEK